MGADLCGIAPVERFSAAPAGFHPQDVYEQCRSVIVFAKQVPAESIWAKSCIPYTFVSSIVTEQTDHLGITLALRFQHLGIGAIPIPSDDPYESWNADLMHGQAILSLRHAGYLAGLGWLGKNTLLITKDFGTMVQLGALLLDIDLGGTPLKTNTVCPSSCRKCLDSCPVHALDGTSVDQGLCRPLSNYRTEKGYILKKCNICRRSCPHYCYLNHGKSKDNK